jgi:hypothetical protein
MHPQKKPAMTRTPDVSATGSITNGVDVSVRASPYRTSQRHLTKSKAGCIPPLNSASVRFRVRPVKVNGQTFAGVKRRKTSERRSGRIPSGGVRRVTLGSARPPRTPSINVEMKEEQQVMDWKSLEQKEKVKR